MGHKIKDIIAFLKKEDVSIIDKKNKLDNEYLESFNKIDELIRLSSISSKERGECLDEAIDLLMYAKDNDIPVEAVIGKLEKPFCNELINSRGNMEIIMQVCKELVKIPIFSLFAVIIYALFNLIDIPLNESFEADVAMLDLFVPTIIVSIIVNVRRYIISNQYGINSEQMESKKLLLSTIQFILSVFGYIVLEEVWAPKSFATTFGRCLFVAVFSLVIAMLVMLFVSLGGFEIVYRKKEIKDFHRRNYQLMLVGFIRQYIKKNDKLEKRNQQSIKLNEYAKELIDEIELTKNILPIIIGVLVLEIYFLGFLMLGIGIKWYLIIAQIVVAIAVAVCTSLMVTRSSRKDMLARMIEKELDIEKFIEIMKE